MELVRGITIIGTGNVAWHLGYIFQKFDIPVAAIVGRNKNKCNELSTFLKVTGTTDYSDIPVDSDLILICVSDSAIKEVTTHLNNIPIPIAHTAASISLAALGTENKMTGVFYPFQTFTKGILPAELAQFPICIEASCQHMSDVLYAIARKISNKVVFINSEQRRVLHLAGILVNNFPNYLFARAYDYLQKNSLDSTLLLPIIDETVRKLHLGDPSKMQTGPAIRGNSQVIDGHIEMLSENPELKEIYFLMSKGINDYFNLK